MLVVEVVESILHAEDGRSRKAGTIVLLREYNMVYVVSNGM